MLKSVLALAAIVGAGGYFTGAFGGGGYTRTVDRPQAEVMAALESLDVTAQPGAPGSTADAAGGVQPLFRLEKAADRMTWYVMSGDKVATAMTATFAPADGGKATRVVASVQRGDAPDDFVSPAFRSSGLTMRLFGMALEGELNELTAPPPADPARCDEIRNDMMLGNMAAVGGRPDNLQQAVGGTAKAVMRIAATAQQLRAAGCDTDSNQREFKGVSNAMGSGDMSGDARPVHSDEVSFEPGKPMVDVSRK
jgi:hypothetical protein